MKHVAHFTQVHDKVYRAVSSLSLSLSSGQQHLSGGSKIAVFVPESKQRAEVGASCRGRKSLASADKLLCQTDYKSENVTRRLVNNFRLRVLASQQIQLLELSQILSEKLVSKKIKDDKYI